MEGTIGEMRVFAGNFAPGNWALCHGQILQISSNTALFSILGTIYGGDGRTTFALPDCRGRSVIGVGRGSGLTDRREGQKGGAEFAHLTVQNLPAHNHAATASSRMVAASGEAEAQSPSEAALAEPESSLYNSNDPSVEMKDGSVSTTVTVQNRGGGQLHDNMSPWIAVNWIICTQGVYPERP